MADDMTLYVRELLRMILRDYSQYHWSNFWIDGLEYDLWSFVCGDSITMWDSGFGRGLQPDDRDRLFDLSVKVDGWFMWSAEENKEVFVPMKKWLKLYKEAAKSSNKNKNH